MAYRAETTNSPVPASSIFAELSDLDEILAEIEGDLEGEPLADLQRSVWQLAQTVRVIAFHAAGLAEALTEAERKLAAERAALEGGEA